MNEIVTHYLATWNETDEAARGELLATHWAADCTYIDPMAEALGHQALSAVIGAVQAQFPGFVFTQVGEVDGHHQQARFQWGLGPAGAEPIVIGSDVVVLDQDKRISEVLGFLDVVPA